MRKHIEWTLDTLNVQSQGHNKALWCVCRCRENLLCTWVYWRVVFALVCIVKVKILRGNTKIDSQIGDWGIAVFA